MQLEAGDTITAVELGERYTVEAVNEQTVELSQISGVTLEWDRADLEADIDDGIIEVR